MNNQINTASTKLEEAKASIAVSMTMVTKDIAVVCGEEDERESYVLEVTEKKDKADAYMDKLSRRLDGIKTQVKDMKDAREGVGLKKLVKTFVADITKGDMKPFKAAMTTFGRTKAIATRSKQAAERKAVSKATQQPTASNPAYEAMVATLVEEKGRQTSAFLTMAGLKPTVLVGKADADIVTDVTKQPYFKAAIRDTTKHLGTGLSASYRPCSEDAKYKKTKKVLTEAFDRIVFASLATGSHEWSEILWTPQVFHMAARHFFCGVSHFCTTDCRLMITGAAIVLGMHHGDLPGETLRDKKTAMMLASAQSLTEWIEHDKAFVIHHKPGELLLVPTSYMCMYAYTSESTGIRWSCCADDADSVRVAETLEGALSSFPDLAKKGYQNWLNFLRDT